jgi:hypothetical protein
MMTTVIDLVFLAALVLALVAASAIWGYDSRGGEDWVSAPGRGRLDERA